MTTKTTWIGTIRPGDVGRSLLRFKAVPEESFSVPMIKKEDIGKKIYLQEEFILSKQTISF